MRILLIEDEKKLARFVQKGLAEQSYSVDVAYDGIKGFDLACLNDYDLIILDIILPKQSGWQTLRKIREEGITTPILILTALGEVNDKVRGLDSGADDYLTKPFEFSELLARVRAILRREFAELEMTLRVDGLVLDPVRHNVERDGKLIKVTSKEFALLEYLMLNHGRVMTRTQISEHVWDVSFDRGSNVIDVYIKSLRQKVDNNFAKRLIHTVIGVGYILREENEQ
jgi:two-component system copper resistance phosphate regulon response regulator CusR